MIWNWSAFLWGFTVGLGLVVAAILGLVLMLCFARTYAAIREWWDERWWRRHLGGVKHWWQRTPKR